MTRLWFNSKVLFGVAAVCFVLVQVKLFSSQSQYADQIATAIKNENECTARSRKMIDQLSTYHGKVISLQEEKNKLALNNQYLSTVIDDLKRHEKVVKPSQDDNGEYIAAVVIMACNRPDYLERTIKSVLKYYAVFCLFYPEGWIIHRGGKYGQKLPGVPFHAGHYKWALSQLFGTRKYRRVIILEDDMEVAPDFFDYFEAMADLLDRDSSLLAASSWNDNGQRQFVHDSELLYRSDFFPGLGWMLNKNIWEELAPKWPAAYPFHEAA
ncbi:hypothetical protein AXG93_1793s1110 [Marchantia polymorpha subsp. ruderalis]|uniref:Alpha-1,3-mannosyl-glycoprotein 2-beta-N-acetylglucosaminyltransferase n=1 Tax=Marchantia polymorpha subsp. ruderalis TaxID=1480154 RepID=A0A176WG32_MARPO|nr:hypothetical protein AXG93_1793s1110 [Marchantia polymorpha subsp. ruderalis]